MDIIYMFLAVVIQLIGYREMPDANSFWIGMCIIFGCTIITTMRRKS